MSEATGPNLLVVGGDTKRLQWLTHHVASHWPDAEVSTLPAEESPALNRLLVERAPDAVILQIDFADEAASGAVLLHMKQMLQVQPALHCILLAENGGEMSAVRALKGGAKDYLPLARITRDQLLTAITEAWAMRRAVAQAAHAISHPGTDVSRISFPVSYIGKDTPTSIFAQFFLAGGARLRRNVVLKVMNRGESQRE